MESNKEEEEEEEIACQKGLIRRRRTWQVLPSVKES